MDTPEGEVREDPPLVREGARTPPPWGPKAPTYVLSRLALPRLALTCFAASRLRGRSRA